MLYTVTASKRGANSHTEIVYIRRNVWPSSGIKLQMLYIYVFLKCGLLYDGLFNYGLVLILP